MEVECWGMEAVREGRVCGGVMLVEGGVGGEVFGLFEGGDFRRYGCRNVNKGYGVLG